MGALALMFLILVTQFNSVIKPLIIATTVLFSVIGIALWVCDNAYEIFGGNVGCRAFCSGGYRYPERNIADRIY
jgi:hypothetical protein